MNEELLQKIAIEIEKSCACNCPCGYNCCVSTDEQCRRRILNWLNSKECIDTVIDWVRLGLGN